MINFSDQQIENYRAYERVRSSSFFNMFDDRARLSAGLDNKDYVFVQRNYLELRAASMLAADTADLAQSK